MADNLIRLEIDELPLDLNFPGQIDYIGRFIGAALTEPLLRYSDGSGTVMPGVLASCAANSDGVSYELKISSDIKWSDGTRVTAAQVASHILAQKDRSSYWKYHLSAVDNIEAIGDYLKVVLKRRLRHWEALLCALELGPSRGNRWSPSSSTLGPYKLESISSDKTRIRLVPNHAIAGAADRCPLEFKLNRDVAEVPLRFEHRLVDVTCSTMFPFPSLDLWRKREEYRTRKSAIWMQLEFGADLQPALLSRDVRGQLASVLDSSVLVDLLNGGVIARHSVLATTYSAAYPRQKCSGYSPSCLGMREIRLAFYDYYPNRIVAEWIAGTWKESFDLDVQLLVVPFQTPAACKTDVRLELRYPLFPDPIAELEPALAMLTRVGTREQIRQAMALVGALSDCAEKTLGSCLDQLAVLLNEAVSVIPLVDLRHHSLISPKVSGLELPCVAEWDYKDVRLHAT